MKQPNCQRAKTHLFYINIIIKGLKSFDRITGGEEGREGGRREGGKDMYTDMQEEDGMREGVLIECREQRKEGN